MVTTSTDAGGSGRQVMSPTRNRTAPAPGLARASRIMRDARSSPTTTAPCAAAVLRRHRLVELFLVQVMGMNWDEVHDEAEQLEHAVSDRLIERIDAMLGHPAVDPHGDPIPDSDGVIHTPDLATLLTCATNQPLRVSRVVDQDAAFLRFIEQSHLKPGQPVLVEERDAAADRVTVRTDGI